MCVVVYWQRITKLLPGIVQTGFATIIENIFIFSYNKRHIHYISKISTKRIELYNSVTCLYIEFLHSYNNENNFVVLPASSSVNIAVLDIVNIPWHIVVFHALIHISSISWRFSFIVHSTPALTVKTLNRKHALLI